MIECIIPSIQCGIILTSSIWANCCTCASLSHLHSTIDDKIPSFYRISIWSNTIYSGSVTATCIKNCVCLNCTHYGFSGHTTSSSDVYVSVISLNACLYVFHAAGMFVPSSLCMVITQSVSASLAFLLALNLSNSSSAVNCGSFVVND